MAAHPDRLAGFAHLPMRSPQAAADELERTVRDLGFCGALINGLTEGRFLDDARFDPILARAEKLDVPIYVHPNLPPPSVREAYYDGLPGDAGFRLSMAAWGWHSEVAIHVLRLVLSGALDRHPQLKVIIGHMGEGLAGDAGRAPTRPCQETSDTCRVRSARRYSTRSGSRPAGCSRGRRFEIALAVFGIDRVLFSIDYPYSSNRLGREFLDGLKLPAADLEKFAHGNADRLAQAAAGG